MGFKKLSEQELSEYISNADEIIAIINGDLKKISIDTLVNLLNKNFDVSIAVNTDTEYKLKVDIGGKTITTPNLRVASITSIKVIKGHLIVYFSDGTSVDAGIVNDNIPEYGAMRDIDSHSPALTRIGAADGLVANVGIGATVVRNDFDNIYPWSEMRKCILTDDGTVAAYEGDVIYSEDGTVGQVMVEIPKFYLKHYIDEIENKEYWYICREQKDDAYRLPQPFCKEDGTELDAIYIAAYLSAPDENNNANSKAGNVHNDTVTYQTCLQQVQNRGANWHAIDVSELTDVLQPLFLVEFATLDSQSVMYGACETNGNFYNIYVTENSCFGDGTDLTKTIVGNTFYSSDMGNGNLAIGQEIAIAVDNEYITDAYDYFHEEEGMGYAVRKVINIEVVHTSEDGNESVKITFDGTPVGLNEEYMFCFSTDRNGITKDIAASSGSNPGSEGIGAMTYRGIENLYGYSHTWLSGILVQNENYYVLADSSASGITTDGYTALNLSVPSANGYIRQIRSDSDIPWVHLPCESGGASNEDFCDNVSVSGTTSNIYACLFGGGTELQSGLFSLNATRPVSAAVKFYLRLAYRAYKPNNTEGGVN